MKFDILETKTCLNPTADDPLDCPTKPVAPVPDDGSGSGDGEPTYKLILKPEYALRQIGEPVQYATYLRNESTGEEELLTLGLTYRCADVDIALIGPNDGRAFGALAGITTISSEWQDLIAFAQLEIIGDCAEVNVGMMLLIDNSESMSQPFSVAPVPAGQPVYATRLAAAKSMAARFANEVDGSKDYVGLIRFNASPFTAQELTQNKVLTKDAVLATSATLETSAIGLGIDEAIAQLNALEALGTIDRKVLVIFSDGENKSGLDGTVAAEAFKQAGGVIVSIAIRAHDAGFLLMKLISTEGMFLSVLPSNALECGDWMSGFKGYFCAGQCEPEGDVTVNHGELDYTGFVQWDVVSGHVDLIGGTYPYEVFNLTPGSGLYVDLSGSGPPWLGKIRTKNNIALTAGHDYTLQFEMAGNQRHDQAGYQTRVRVENPEDSVDETITIDNFAQDWTVYSYTFTAPTSANAKISFEQVASGMASIGNLLDNVLFRDDTLGVDLFYDHFNDENPVYIPPGCVNTDLDLLALGYGYCTSYGCIDTPVTQQTPDPDPLPDPE